MLSAWEAVEPIQRNHEPQCWLIAQPDHAALAGNIAQQLNSDLFPSLDEAVLQGIGLHDEGWAPFDARTADSLESPRSFVEEAPATFVEAWTASIKRCQEVAPIAGAIASKHFCRLAEFRLGENRDIPEDTRLLLGFLSAEKQRQHVLLSECPNRDAEFLTSVLQFCDLLSLYLCCGAQEDVFFSQLRFEDVPIRLERVRTGDNAAICRLSCAGQRRPILSGMNELAVSARRWPGASQWREFLFVLE